MCAKKNCQKAQSPEIRGFGVFDVQDFFSDAEVSGVESVPDAGSWCIEAVHGLKPGGDPNVQEIQMWKGLAPDSSVSASEYVVDTPQSGASPLPHLIFSG
ncbi:hypothetical protein [Pseudomonas cerasi]